MKYIERTLLSYLEQYAAEDGEKTLFFTENERWSVSRVLTETRAAGQFLYTHGIRPGSMVALNCVRCPQTAILLFALQALGTVAVLCDPHTGTEECLNRSGLDIPVSASLNLTNGQWIFSDPNGTCPLEWAQAEAFEFPAVDVRAPSLIVFTSGSTGKSKGVVLSQYNVLNYVENYRPCGSYTTSDISPEVLPLHHVFGLAVILTGLVNRYQVFFPENIRPEYLAQCIRKYRLTRLDGVPSFAYALANAVASSGYDTSSLRVGVLGGAPSSRQQFDYIQQTLGLKLLPAYGQSECLVISGIGPEASDDLRSGSVGKFLPMSRGFILDSQGQPLPDGEVGEVCVCAPEVMLGYYNDEAATRKAVDSQGRLHTGDLGYVDAQGFLHITGRMKDIIICNGNNLSAAYIENKLSNLPFVAQAAVTALPDPRCGEVPSAMIVLKEGQPYDEEAVKAVLVKNEVPKVLLFANRLPLTSSGKPDKQRIRGMLLSV